MQEPYLFLSHSSLDHDFTAQLAEHLHDAGFRCWVDVEDIPDGSTWMREIEQAVAGCEALIVVLSKDGRASEWVERETLMAMNLRKPIFIARIDDTPLPIHLINRQFSDFRTRPEAATQKLIAALRKAPLTEPKKLTPEPNRLNFFKYVEQLPGGADNARIARALFDWAKAEADSITFSGSKEPTFQANLWIGPGGVTVFSVHAYTKQPAVEVSLQYLMSFPPYDQRDERLRLLDRLNHFVSEPFEADRADRRPNIPLVALSDGDALDAFLSIIDEIVMALRAAPPESPDRQ